MSERYTEEQYQEALRRKMVGSGFPEENYLDTEPDVIISDSGAHVQIWAWISDDELEEMGIEPGAEPEEEDESEGVCSYECEECGEMRDTGDTECPHCGKADDAEEE